EHILNFDEKYDKTSNKKLENKDFPIFENHSPLKIIELCYKYDKLNILTLGPLTNIAAAYMLDPNIVNHVNRLVIMGGTPTHKGNVTECVEFNFYCDPIATKMVLDNFKNVTIYPWEPCEFHLFTEEEIHHCEIDDKGIFCQ